VHQWLPQDFEQEKLSSLPAVIKQGLIFAKDPRYSGLGWRSISTPTQKSEVDALFLDRGEQIHPLPIECHMYDKFRAVFGIPEGATELHRNKGIALEGKLIHALFLCVFL
jgi:hypothetical protein